MACENKCETKDLCGRAPGDVRAILHITVVCDTVCPWSFVGKRRMELALKHVDPSVHVRVYWKPFQLNPARTESVPKQQVYDMKFGPERHAQMQAKMKEVGEEVGINFGFRGVICSSFDSHRLIAYATRFCKQNEVTESIFVHYFEKNEDISQLPVLLEIATECGLDEDDTKAFLQSDELSEQVHMDVGKHFCKVSGTPLYCFQYQSRQETLHGGQSIEIFKALLEDMGVPMKCQQAPPPPSACSYSSSKCMLSKLFGCTVRK